MKRCNLSVLSLIIALLSFSIEPSFAWFDETHIMIGKADGYPKWFLGAGADMVKVKASKIENHNHYVNNAEGATVTPEMVFEQAGWYDRPEKSGHLYGAILASVRNYINDKRAGKYAEYQFGGCLHYVGDLSQPLHNTGYETSTDGNTSSLMG